MKKVISLFSIMALLFLSTHISVMADTCLYHYSIDPGASLRLLDWNPSTQEERVFKWEWSYVYTGDGGRIEFESRTAMNPKITGIAPGTVRICCTYSVYSYDYSTATEKTKFDIYEIEIREVPISKVTFNESSLSLVEGQKGYIQSIIYPTNATSKQLTWISSDSGIASVSRGEMDGVGIVTAISPGTATITVSVPGDSNITNLPECTVTVKKRIPATSISLNKNEMSLLTGDREQLTATVLPYITTDKKIIWTTDNPEIADVSDGMVTAISRGTATITATTESGEKTATCTVNVTELVGATSISLDIKNTSLRIGESKQLIATVYPETATYKNVTWVTDDPEIAEVTDDGIVTAKSIGQTCIRAFCNTYQASCIVNVNGDDIFEYGTMYSDDIGPCTSIIGVKDCDISGVLVVPDHVGECRITSVTLPVLRNIKRIEFGDNIEYISGLNNQQSLEYVKLPSNMSNVGISGTNVNNGLFANDKSLHTVVLPKNAESIRSYAFYNCNALESISIPNTVKTIGNGVFAGCSSLKTVELGNQLEKIGEEAFALCSSLENLYIPDSVTEIGEWAFSYTAIRQINFPNSLKSEYAVVGATCCSNIEQVIFDNNPYFCSDESGAVYSKDKKTFVALPTPQDKSYTVCDGTETIGNNAFLEGRTLLVTPPETLKPRSLTVTLPLSIKEIKKGAFCKTIKDIYYKGTETEWNSIIIDQEVARILSENATIHYLGEEDQNNGDDGGDNLGNEEQGNDDENGYTTLTVSNGTTRAGDTVDTIIDLSNSSNIAGMILKLSYDDNLELKNIARGDALSGLTFTPPADLTKNNLTLLWDGVEGESGNGTILTLTFKVKDNVEEGIYNISLNYSQGDIYDDDLNDINVKIVNGSITVIDYILGDVNDDGKINAKDITVLRRYISGDYEVSANENAADVNHDKAINAKDITILRRYISGDYGITLD